MQSKEIIAVIRLSPGEAGYYDPLSKIHLTIGKPQREIFAGTNCTQLRRSVASRRLRLISGSLGENAPIVLQTNETKERESAVSPQSAPVPAETVDVPVKDEKSASQKSAADKSGTEKKSARKKAQ